MTPQQKYGQLLKLIKLRDRAVARNNKLAATNSVFAQRLAAARATPLDAQAAAAVAQAHQAMRGMGMGYAGIIVGGVAAVVLSVLAIAGTIVFYQIWREEREWASANPVQSSIQSGTKAVWAVFGVGLLALGGLLYWDYRKGQAMLPYSPRASLPFDIRPGFDATRRTDMSAKAGMTRRQLGAEARQIGADAGRLGAAAKGAWSEKYGKTKADPSIAERMEEERAIWEAAHQAELAERRAPVNLRRGPW